MELPLQFASQLDFPLPGSQRLAAVVTSLMALSLMSINVSSGLFDLGSKLEVAGRCCNIKHSSTPSSFFKWLKERSRNLSDDETH